MGSGGDDDLWRTRFLESVISELGEEKARAILSEGEEMDRVCTAEENVHWTKGCIERMRAVAKDEEIRQVLMGCSHHMPEDRIRILRDFHRHHRDINELMEFWRSQFIYNLKRWTAQPLKDEWLDIIIDENWGEVGVRKGSSVMATKIPNDIKGFFEAKDYAERSYRYCHCDRMRTAFLTDSADLPVDYCYCGAGFYRSNWERVLERPVQVTLLSSLMKGDTLCQFRISLPELH